MLYFMFILTWLCVPGCGLSIYKVSCKVLLFFPVWFKNLLPLAFESLTLQMSFGAWQLPSLPRRICSYKTESCLMSRRASLTMALQHPRKSTSTCRPNGVLGRHAKRYSLRVVVATFAKDGVGSPRSWLCKWGIVMGTDIPLSTLKIWTSARYQAVRTFLMTADLSAWSERSTVTITLLSFSQVLAEKGMVAHGSRS